MPVIVSRFRLHGHAGHCDSFVIVAAVEVADHLVADAINPMVVNVVDLAGGAFPVDGAAGLDVLGGDLLFGVYVQFETEGIGALAPIRI